MTHRLIISLCIVIGFILPFFIGYIVLKLAKEYSRDDPGITYLLGAVVGLIISLIVWGIFEWIEWIIHG